LIVAGATTNGCERATLVEAFSNNYRLALVEEGCLDRSQASHALGLCDIHAKYADVVKLGDVIGFIETLQSGLFELPPARHDLHRLIEKPGSKVWFRCRPDLY
jgi:maleamate amidohydrolase